MGKSGGRPKFWTLRDHVCRTVRFSPLLSAQTLSEMGIQLTYVEGEPRYLIADTRTKGIHHIIKEDDWVIVNTNTGDVVVTPHDIAVNQYVPVDVPVDWQEEEE